jgi:hypothetical protein
MDAALMTKESLERSISTLEVWAIVFAVVVAVGVVGEAICGFKHWSKDRQLRRVLKIEEQNLELQIETLRKQNNEFSLRLAPRSFGTIPNVMAAVSRLKQFSGTAINVIVYPIKDDREMQEFAAGIKDILRRSGWKVFEPIEGEYNSPPIWGTSVEVILARNSPQTDPKQMEAADELIKELLAVRVAVGGPQAILPWNGESTQAGSLKLNPEARINIVIGKHQ